MNRNQIIEALARSILETTQEFDHIEGNVDRDMEELGDAVQRKCEELAPQFLDSSTIPDEYKRDWIVPVERQVFEEADPENYRTVYGKIRVSAMTALEAADAVREMMRGDNPLQTLDDRIVWDHGDLPVDPDYGHIDGWDYVDCTFDVVDDEGVESAVEGSIFNAEFVTVWDGGVEVRTSCKFDYALNRVYDIEVCEEVDGLETLEEEYVETSDGSRFEIDEESEIKVCR